MIKTFSYSDENNEFLDMEQNNYFFEGEDCKILYFNGDKNEYYIHTGFTTWDRSFDFRIDFKARLNRLTAIFLRFFLSWL